MNNNHIKPKNLDSEIMKSADYIFSIRMFNVYTYPDFLHFLYYVLLLAIPIFLEYQFLELFKNLIHRIVVNNQDISVLTHIKSYFCYSQAYFCFHNM